MKVRLKRQLRRLHTWGCAHQNCIASNLSICIN